MAKKKGKEKKANAEYELKPVQFKSGTRCIVGFDPGSRNMGVACVAVNEEMQVKVVANSIITNPVNDLVAFTSSSEKFMAEVDRWTSCYSPHALIAERFQTRGNSGPLIEYCSAMLALIRGINRTIPFKAITAATWKNAWHRRFEPLQLDDMYKLTLTTPHQLDAIFIGIFGLEQGLQVELDYDPFDIVKQAEASSAVRLINKRR
jgi:hypothetical protein